MQRAVLVEQDLDKIKALVAKGVDPNAPIGCGNFSPLDGAVQVENPAMLRLLLSLGAKPIDRQLVRAAFIANHETASEIVSNLLEAGVPVGAREYDLSRKRNSRRHCTAPYGGRMRDWSPYCSHGRISSLTRWMSMTARR